MGRQSLRALAAILCCGLVTGCGGTAEQLERSVVPVTGRVLFRGEPIEDADVVLHPVTPPDDGLQVFSPRAKTGADGTFKISTYRADDGAPPGRYMVSFSWCGPLAGLTEDEQDELAERLPKKWLLPATTGVEVEIADVEAGVTLNTFELN